MRVLVAPDSFKPAVKAVSVAQAMARGILQSDPSATVFLSPLANGDAGTLDIVVRAQQGRMRQESVALPDQRPVHVRWAWLPNRLAFVAASEWPVGANHADPENASSRGLGQLLAQILRYQPQEIVVALGSTPVLDGGMGLLEAFGAQFLDEGGRPAGVGIRGLARVRDLDVADMTIPRVPLTVLIDSDAPLIGDKGLAADGEGLQGALRPHQIPRWTEALGRYARLLEERLAVSLGRAAGTASAGGLGFALALLGGGLVAGPPRLADLAALDTHIASADWILSGCGRLDGGKESAPLTEVLRRARPRGIPVIALAAHIDPGHRALYDLGLTGAYPILDKPRALPQALRATATMIESASFRVATWMARTGVP